MHVNIAFGWRAFPKEYALDQLLGLDIVHAVHTRNTVTAAPLARHGPWVWWCIYLRLPDRQDTARLGQTGLFLHATDPLLEDGRDLGGRGLGVGRIAAGEGGDDGGRGALL